MNKSSTVIFIILLILSGSLMPGAPARSLEGTEYQIKAAMMINFIKFVEWPDDPNKSEELLVFGIIGEDKFGDTLNQIQDRIVNGKLLTLRRFNSTQDLNQCQVVFVPESESYRINEILASLSGWPVLTIGETDNFTQLGGIIRFYIDENHVRFEINKTAAMQSKLKISAKLMEIARVID
jgi:hypothetical protein